MLETGRVRAVVDLDAGVLRELALDGRNVLADGPRLQLWRAPTDNDGLPQVPSRRSGVLPRWLELGLDRLAARARLRARARHRRRARPPRRRASSRTGSATGCSPSGELLVENVVELAPKLRDVPRIGAGLALLPGLERLAWYGRGPWEAYSDRLASTVVGRFESTVTDEYVPVHRPAGARPPSGRALADADRRRRASASRCAGCRRSASARATSPPPT